MQRLAARLMISGAVIGWAPGVLAQTGGTPGGVQVTAPAPSPADVRQDPNSALDFGAVRGAGAGSVGENFRGNLGAATPGAARDLGQGLPTIGAPPLISPRNVPDLSPNLRKPAPEAYGDSAAMKRVEQSLILPRFRTGSVENLRRSDANWRYRYFQGRWWYWLPSNGWSYWDGTRWLRYAAAAEQ